MFWFKTIRDGERAVLWDKNGRMRVVDGPKNVFMAGRSFEPLSRFSAAPAQYLVVKFKDGSQKHVKGPASIWIDPVAHESISVREMIQIEANELVVSYAEEEGGRIARKIIRGPGLYMPSENEWLHQFRWHGADPRNPRRKIPRGLNFEKLRTIPDQMYFDVEDVRTADDALVVVKLMIFFEIRDIDRMLDQTHDLVGDFINAVSADVIDHISSLTFEEFKEKTDALNELSTYKMLLQRAEKVGYTISKVVYRGYYASDALQAMHNNAIESRTRLVLESETEAQAQELADMKLKKESERAIARRSMEKEEIEHKSTLAKVQHDEIMRQKEQDEAFSLEAKKRACALEIEQERKKNAQQEEFLKGLRAMDVDITRYLVAQYQTADKLIRIDGKDNTRLHIHQEC